MATNLHISLSAEPIATIGDFALTNSIFTSLVVSALLITFAVAVRVSLKNSSKPTGIQNVAEFIIESLYNLVHGITESRKKTHEFFPFVATFFLFIMLNNYLGLLPGVGTVGFAVEEKAEEHASTVAAVQVASTPTSPEITDTNESTKIEETLTEESETTKAEATESESTEKHTSFVPLFRPGTADLNTTLALALISVFLTQFFGVKHLSMGYFQKYINFSNPINFYVGILEIVSEFAKILSFAFRLFGNIFAGEVLLGVIGALIPVVAPMPFYGLEIFVGFVQALVFSMLTLVFFNMATHGHGEQ